MKTPARRGASRPGSMVPRLQPVLWDNDPPDNRLWRAPCRRPCFEQYVGSDFRAVTSKRYGCEKDWLKQERSMFVNTNGHPGSRSKVLGELGELSRTKAILSEFKYRK